jgi:hypothetical protein
MSILCDVIRAVRSWGRDAGNSQTHDTERDDPVGVEDVGNAQRKTKDYTQYSGPKGELDDMLQAVDMCTAAGRD